MSNNKSNKFDQITVNAEAIEQLVTAANNHEEETQALLLKLEKDVADLPSAISLPDEQPAIALREFVVEYINHVPSFIAAVAFAARDAGINEYVEPFLEVAKNFFLEPVNKDSTEGSLEELMQQAYLSHRLIEEVNDQYIVRAGIPLIPMEMTKANIIVHQLVGETLANSLDEVVESVVHRRRIGVLESGPEDPVDDTSAERSGGEEREEQGGATQGHDDRG